MIRQKIRHRGGLPAGVEACHELAVGGAGGGEVLVAFGQADAQLLVVLGELSELMSELAGVVGCAEPGLALGLLAERLGQALFELADAGGQAAGSFVRGEQVGLQRVPGDGRPGYASGPEGNLVLGDVDVIIQNISTMVVTLTELGIEPTDFTGPLTILSGYRSSFAKTINSGSSFYYTIRPNVFAELLLSLSDPPAEQRFSIYVQTGHGSTAKCWKSTPFSVKPSEL